MGVKEDAARDRLRRLERMLYDVNDDLVDFLDATDPEILGTEGGKAAMEILDPGTDGKVVLDRLRTLQQELSYWAETIEHRIGGPSERPEDRVDNEDDAVKETDRLAAEDAENKALFGGSEDLGRLLPKGSAAGILETLRAQLNENAMFERGADLAKRAAAGRASSIEPSVDVLKELSDAIESNDPATAQRISAGIRQRMLRRAADMPPPIVFAIEPGSFRSSQIGFGPRRGLAPGEETEVSKVSDLLAFRAQKFVSSPECVQILSMSVDSRPLSIGDAIKAGETIALKIKNAGDKSVDWVGYLFGTERERAPSQDKIERAIFFDEVEIPPKGCVRVDARVPDEYALFKGHRFVVRESVDGATSIPFFFIGNELQYPAVPGSIADGVASAVFSENARSGGSYSAIERSPGPTRLGYTLPPDVPPEVGRDIVTPAIAFVYNGHDEPVKWSGELRGLAVIRK